MKMRRTPRLHLYHRCTAYLCCFFCALLLGIFFLPLCVFAQEKQKPDFHLTLADVELASLQESLTTIVERPDDELLITSLYLGNILLRDDLLVYEDLGRDDFFVPLQDIVMALELPITVDVETGTAKGWVLSESSGFDLDLNKATLKLGDKSIPLNRQNTELHEDGIYVSLKALAEWFPLTVELDYNDLKVSLKTLQPFPLELKMARDTSRGKLGKHKNKQEQHDLEAIKSPLFTTPNVLVSSQAIYNNADIALKSLLTSYTTLGTGIVLGQDTKFSINDTIGDDGAPDIRLTMGRKDLDKNLLGLGISEYKLGDVNSNTVPFLAKSNSGRGVSFSNKELNAYSGTQSRTVTLRGDLPVGYQIDIVKDGQLIGFVEEPDENGEYAFEAGVLTGLNVFEIVFYGPQGQKETREERVYVPVNPIKKGEFNYTFSAIQDDVHIVSNKSESLEIDPDIGKNRVVAEAEYGLSENGSLYTSLASLAVEGTRKNYGLLRYGYSFKGIRSDVSVAQTENGGRGIGLGLQSVFKGIRWQAEHKLLYDFESEETLESGLAGNLRHNSSLAVSGLVPFVRSVPFSFDLDRLENTDGLTLATWRARVTNNIKKLRLTTQIDQRLQKNQSTTTDLGMQLSSRFQNVNLRGTMVYGIQPDRFLKNANLTADWKYDDLTTLRGALRYNGGDEAVKDITLGISHDYDFMKLGASVTYNDKQEALVLLSSSFSLGLDPVRHKLYMTKKDYSDSAMYVPRVFYDKNNNSVFDDKDEWLEDIGFIGNGIDKKIKTNKQGYAFVPARAYERSYISLDGGNLPDPYLRSRVKPKDHILRSNQTVFKDFPVVMTGEFDTQIYAFTKGKKNEAQSINVQVLSSDGQIVEKGKSEYDGFVSVGNIPLGQYDVRLDPEQVKSLGYCPVPVKSMMLDLENPAVSLDSFTLWPQGKDGHKNIILGKGMDQEQGISLWNSVQDTLRGLFLENKDVPMAYLIAKKVIEKKTERFDLILYNVDKAAADFMCKALGGGDFSCSIEDSVNTCPEDAIEISQIDLHPEARGVDIVPDPQLNIDTLKPLDIKDIENIIGE